MTIEVGLLKALKDIRRAHQLVKAATRLSDAAMINPDLSLQEKKGFAVTRRDCVDHMYATMEDIFVGGAYGTEEILKIGDPNETTNPTKRTR